MDKLSKTIKSLESDVKKPRVKSISIDIDTPKLNKIDLNKVKINTNKVKINLDDTVKDIPEIIPEINNENSKKYENFVKKMKKKSTQSIKSITENNSVSIDISLVNVNDMRIKVSDTILADRYIKRKEPLLLMSSPIYLNNRKQFIEYMNRMLIKIKDHVETYERPSKGFRPLLHQDIVKHYINAMTPYRGVLLYHGLGSGKTCSSIVITESLKHNKKIIVLTPASLRSNYIKQLQFCGDILYRKNQFWEYVSVTSDELAESLSRFLQIDKMFIIENGGVWVFNETKDSNFESLSSSDQIAIDKQLSHMIDTRYTFINYNGLKKDKIEKMMTGSNKEKINPFDNKVIVVDEVHNLVGSIANSIDTIDSTTPSISVHIYNFIRTAVNSRVIFLSGTPIINYPNELAILFNMIRGDVYTYSVEIMKNKLYDEKMIRTILKETQIIDRMDYNSRINRWILTRNPYGFISDGDGVELGEDGNVNNFLNNIKKSLTKKGIQIMDNTKVDSHKLFPDKLESFNEMFLDEENDEIKNKNIFIGRILGLVSYVADLTHLMPKYDKTSKEHFEIVKIPMSDYQLNLYDAMRTTERRQESKISKKMYQSTSSSYKIYSRCYCNFVFPQRNGNLLRPFKETSNSDVSEENVDTVESNEYRNKIEDALSYMKDNGQKIYTHEALLDMYSPKFAKILENIQNIDNYGIHLLYSVFKTLEGLGIFSEVLNYNGYSELKIKKNESGEYIVDIPDNISRDEFMTRPWYVKYTGDHSTEEKDILRNALNSTWGMIPSKNVIDVLNEKFKKSGTGDIPNNYNGSIVKLIMITKSGAEGINLYNVRYVHIMEPYWHPVRVEQVIGRARRLNSHDNLEEKYRSIKVFIYLMTFSDEQLQSDKVTFETRVNDVSRRTNRVITTDESLYEIMLRKENINTQLLTTIKSAAFDCNIHRNKNGINCFTYGKTSDEYAYEVSYEDDETNFTEVNQETRTLNTRLIQVPDPKNPKNMLEYQYDDISNIIYDKPSFERNEILPIGIIENGYIRFFK